MSKIIATDDGFRREIQFVPAYDLRNPDPKKNYVIHCMDIAFFLTGPKATLQFVLSSGWYTPSAQASIGTENLQYFCAHGTDIGYYATTPQFHGQTPMAVKCEWSEGACFYDGTSLGSDELFKRFVAEGEDVVWSKLRAWYDERFGGTSDTTVGRSTAVEMIRAVFGTANEGGDEHD